MFFYFILFFIVLFEQINVFIEIIVVVSPFWVVSLYIDSKTDGKKYLPLQNNYPSS